MPGRRRLGMMMMMGGMMGTMMMMMMMGIVGGGLTPAEARLQSDPLRRSRRVLEFVLRSLTTIRDVHTARNGMESLATLADGQFLPPSLRERVWDTVGRVQRTLGALQTSCGGVRPSFVHTHPSLSATHHALRIVRITTNVTYGAVEAGIRVDRAQEFVTQAWEAYKEKEKPSLRTIHDLVSAWRQMDRGMDATPLLHTQVASLYDDRGGFRVHTRAEGPDLESTWRALHVMAAHHEFESFFPLGSSRRNDLLSFILSHQHEDKGPFSIRPGSPENVFATHLALECLVLLDEVELGTGRGNHVARFVLEMQAADGGFGRSLSSTRSALRILEILGRLDSMGDRLHRGHTVFAPVFLPSLIFPVWMVFVLMIFGVWLYHISPLTVDTEALAEAEEAEWTKYLARQNTGKEVTLTLFRDVVTKTYRDVDGFPFDGERWMDSGEWEVISEDLNTEETEQTVIFRLRKKRLPGVRRRQALRRPLSFWRPYWDE